MTAEAQRHIAVFVKSAVTLTLLAALLWHVGTADLLAQLRSVSPWALGLSIAVLAANVLFVAPRWAEILAALDWAAPGRRLLRGVMVGFLLNQLLPTAVGGDIWRAWYAHRCGAPLKVAIHSVIIDRGFGVVAIALLLLLCLPFDRTLGFHPALQGSLYTAAAAVLLAVSAAFVFPALPVTLIPVLSTLQAGARELAMSFTVVALALRRNLLVTTYSLAGQTIPIIAVAVLARSLVIDIPLLGIAIVTLASMLLATIPLSLGGWGIREGSMVVLFGVYGVPADAAFGVSILFGGCLTLSALPGIFFLAEARHPSRPPSAS